MARRCDVELKDGQLDGAGRGVPGGTRTVLRRAVVCKERVHHRAALPPARVLRYF